MKALPEQYNISEMVSPLLERSPETCVVLIQNGIMIEKGFPPETPILSVVAYVGVSQTSSAVIEHKALGKLNFGGYTSPELPKEKREAYQALLSRRIAEFSDLLKKGGVEHEINENIQLTRWHKIMWNASFNPVSILAGGVDTKALLSNPELERLIRELMEEIQEVALTLLGRKEQGFPPELWSIEKYLEVTRGMPPYKPSMLLDHESRRPMEVEAILGNALREARAANVQTPRLQAVYSLISSVQKINLSQ